MTNTIISFFLLTVCLAKTYGQDKTPFKKEIPMNCFPEMSYTFTYLEARQLKLDTLENGFDSIQIRIWVQPSSEDNRAKDQLYIFKFDRLNWIGNYYSMIASLDMRKQSYSFQNLIQKEIIPKSGWNSFIEKLQEKRLMDLPTMEDIDGIHATIDKNTGDTLYHAVFDGVGYSIEISTLNSYRFINYNNPEYYQKFWQVQFFIDILKVLESEFDISDNKRKK